MHPYNREDKTVEGKIRHLSIEHGVGLHDIASKIAMFASGVDVNDDCN